MQLGGACRWVLLLLACTWAAARLLSHEQYLDNFKCCPTSYVLDIQTVRCICPQKRPFVNATGYCVGCDSPATWNAASKSCSSSGGAGS